MAIDTKTKLDKIMSNDAYVDIDVGARADIDYNKKDNSDDVLKKISDANKILHIDEKEIKSADDIIYDKNISTNTENVCTETENFFYHMNKSLYSAMMYYVWLRKKNPDVKADKAQIIDGLHRVYIISDGKKTIKSSTQESLLRAFKNSIYGYLTGEKKLEGFMVEKLFVKLIAYVQTNNKRVSEKTKDDIYDTYAKNHGRIGLLIEKNKSKKAKTKSNIKAKSKSKSKSKSKTNSKAKSKVKSKSKSKAKSKVKSKSKAKTNSKSKTKAKSKSKSKAKAKTISKSKANPKSKTKAKSKVNPEHNPDPKSKNETKIDGRKARNKKIKHAVEQTNICNKLLNIFNIDPGDINHQSEKRILWKDVTPDMQNKIMELLDGEDGKCCDIFNTKNWGVYKDDIVSKYQSLTKSILHACNYDTNSTTVRENKVTNRGIIIKKSN